MLAAEDHALLEDLFGQGVQEIHEAAKRFIFLPLVEPPRGCSPSPVMGLYVPEAIDGYESRLYLSSPITLRTGIVPPTAAAVYVGRTWYAASIRGISPALRPHEAILAHIARYRLDN